MHLGRVLLSSSWLPELLGPGKAQNTGATESTLLWNTGGLEARSAGHAPYRAAGSLSSVDGESNTPPSPQRDGTSNLNKSPPPPACVRAETRH